MEIQDLERFLVIAQKENMQSAADELDTSTSVLSKSLKRLENSINTRLFDRVGKYIKLNDAGRLMQTKAAIIVAKSHETKAEFLGFASIERLRISGPVALLSKYACEFTEFASSTFPESLLSFDTCYEADALKNIDQGTADIALVTTALTPQIAPQYFQLPLGKISMKIAASLNHPLAKQTAPILSEDVLSYPFAVPNKSPFCGERRGIGCDGWQNSKFPRLQKVVVNDYAILIQIVRESKTLAYLPEYLISDFGLCALDTGELLNDYFEEALLVTNKPGLVKGFSTKS